MELHFDKDVRKKLENAKNIDQDIHPSGEHHQFDQNYTLENDDLGRTLHFRAVLEQARRLGLEDAQYHIPPYYLERLDKTEDFPTPPWEK
ncbi:MAG: hypothetical protein O3C61_07425 [Proteobacteria bacterium]|nr:hypothetical protein [Pseudomonadota bacterium]